MLLPLTESKPLSVVFLLALSVALVARRWWRYLVSTRSWRALPRLTLPHWYRLAFRQRAFCTWSREMSLEQTPLPISCVIIADGHIGLFFLLYLLLQPEMTLRLLLDLSLLAGRLVPAARRTC